MEYQPFDELYDLIDESNSEQLFVAITFGDSNYISIKRELDLSTLNQIETNMGSNVCVIIVSDNATFDYSLIFTASGSVALRGVYRDYNHGQSLYKKAQLSREWDNVKRLLVLLEDKSGLTMPTECWSE